MSDIEETKSVREKSDYFSAPETDVLTCTNPEEALEYMLDDIGDSEERPTYVRLWGFKRKELTYNDACQYVEEMLELIDEEYQHVDALEDNDDVWKSGDEFAKMLAKEYISTICIPAGWIGFEVAWDSNRAPSATEKDEGIIFSGKEIEPGVKYL